MQRVRGRGGVYNARLLVDLSRCNQAELFDVMFYFISGRLFAPALFLSLTLCLSVCLAACLSVCHFYVSVSLSMHLFSSLSVAFFFAVLRPQGPCYFYFALRPNFSLLDIVEVRHSSKLVVLAINARVPGSNPTIDGYCSTSLKAF